MQIVKNIKYFCIRLTKTQSRMDTENTKTDDRQAMAASVAMPADVQEERPAELDCDVVRFQNNREKWVAFVGLFDGRPYEIFTGLQDDEEGIMIPNTDTK